MPGKPYGSETSRFRNDLVGFCEGYGCDIGYGGDPIKPSAIAIDYPEGCMAYCGDHPLQLGGDARSLKWFNDNSLDYVYSSHCLEDFENTDEVLVEWLRVLRKGGRLVLLLPDQQRYEEHCRKHGHPPNPAHKIPDFGLIYLKSKLADKPYTKVIYEKDILHDYNFEIVIEKTQETFKEKKPPVIAEPLSGPIPFPPVELRRVVGPTEESYFDNPTGSLIWGDLAFNPLKPAEAYSAIFDFGCGCGRNARQLMQQKMQPERYMGIDISPELIDWCHNNLTPRNPSFSFMHHDVHSVTYAPGNSNNRHLPFPASDGEYTLFNAHSVFTHLYYDQCEYYLKEARRILNETGVIRSTWFFFNEKMFPVLAPSQHCLYVNELDPTQAVYYDWEQFLTMVHSLDLSVISVKWTEIPGHQNLVYLGKSDTFKDISSGLMPANTVIGF